MKNLRRVLKLPIFSCSIYSNEDMFRLDSLNIFNYDKIQNMAKLNITFHTNKKLS